MGEPAFPHEGVEGVGSTTGSAGIGLDGRGAADDVTVVICACMGATSSVLPVLTRRGARAYVSWGDEEEVLAPGDEPRVAD